MKKLILYFAISFVLQFIWFGLVHPNRGVTLLDMFRYAIGLYLHLPFSWAYWFRVPIV